MLCFADHVDAVLSLVFDEVFEDPSPFVDEDNLPISIPVIPV